MDDGENYVIGWVDTRTRETGQGTSRFTQEKARQLCDDLDGAYPLVTHFPVPVAPRPVIVVEGEDNGA